MKKLVWLSIVGCVFASIESTQAITERNVAVSVAGSDKLTTLSDSFANDLASKETSLATPKAVSKTATTVSTTKSAATSKTTTTTKTTPVVVTPTLASLLSDEEQLRIATITAHEDLYMPESLDPRIHPTTTTTSTTKPTSSTTGAHTVPDRTATAGLFGIALLGTVVMRKKLTP